jgi:hypothetical protein
MPTLSPELLSRVMNEVRCAPTHPVFLLNSFGQLDADRSGRLDFNEVLASPMLLRLASTRIGRANPIEPLSDDVVVLEPEQVVPPPLSSAPKSERMLKAPEKARPASPSKKHPELNPKTITWNRFQYMDDNREDESFDGDDFARRLRLL